MGETKKRKQAQNAADRQANKERHGKEARTGQEPGSRERVVEQREAEEHSRQNRGPSNPKK